MARHYTMPQNFYPQHPDNGCGLAKTLLGRSTKCINCKLPACYYCLSRTNALKLNRIIRQSGAKRARTAYSSLFR